MSSKEYYRERNRRPARMLAERIRKRNWRRANPLEAMLRAIEANAAERGSND